jgi:hypothetical protein
MTKEAVIRLLGMMTIDKDFLAKFRENPNVAKYSEPMLSQSELLFLQESVNSIEQYGEKLKTVKNYSAEGKGR